MPVHDWTRVQAGTFHHFHCAWITHLAEALNQGLLPEGYYALSEQHAGRPIADVLTLHSPGAALDASHREGGLAVADAPPKVTRRLVASREATYRVLRRTLTIRHISGHRIIAILEIVSPGNKDRDSTVKELADKIDSALRLGIDVLLIDLFAPGRYDPAGVHGAVWERYGAMSDDEVSVAAPFTLASYMADSLPEAYVEHRTLGDDLPDMPLFLDLDYYINIPLESTYRVAHQGVPSYWREVLDGRLAPEPD
jgi:hypothetical protein